MEKCQNEFPNFQVILRHIKITLSLGINEQRNLMFTMISPPPVSIPVMSPLPPRILA